MELRKLQNLVADFVERTGIDTGEPLRMLDVVSEVGELAKEILKSTEYGKKPFRPTAAWNDELGDVMFSLICLANRTNVDLEAAVIQALKKYRHRVESKGDVGSGA